MEFLTVSADPTALGHGVTDVVVAEVGTPAEQAPEPGFFGGMSGVVVMYVVIFGFAWLLIIRPQKKRQKTQQEMLSSLQVGDNIVTNSGLFGKIVDVGADVYIVEFGTVKGVRIPVTKTEILAKKEPSLS